MARIEKVKVSVSRLVDVWRESDPLPGEGPPSKAICEQLGQSLASTVVGDLPLVQTGRWRRFWVESGLRGDRLLRELAAGPIKARPGPGGVMEVDLDRIERA
jgi:hypothetical protein